MPFKQEKGFLHVPVKLVLHEDVAEDSNVDAGGCLGVLQTAPTTDVFTIVTQLTFWKDSVLDHFDKVG